MAEFPDLVQTEEFAPAAERPPRAIDCKIDLYSDTKMRPCQRMRRAMASAAVGDERHPVWILQIVGAFAEAASPCR